MKLKKLVSIFIASTLCISALAGCTASEKGSSDNSSSVGNVSKNQDNSEKVLRIAFPDTLTSADVTSSSSSTMLKEVAGVVETLVYADSNFKLQPMHATEWDMTGDNTWVFKLREGI